jgi:hypothetical protein
MCPVVFDGFSDYAMPFFLRRWQDESKPAFPAAHEPPTAFVQPNKGFRASNVRQQQVCELCFARDTHPSTNGVSGSLHSPSGFSVINSVIA